MTTEQWADRLVLAIWLAQVQTIADDAYSEQRRVTLTPPNGRARDAALEVLTEFEQDVLARVVRTERGS